MEAERITCDVCDSQYGFCDDGRPDLIVGERYDDPTPIEALLSEEKTNASTTERYWLPLFRKLWPDPPTPPKILSIGCGVGTDVETLCDAGYIAVGVDCGKRVDFWSRRRYPNHLVRANANYLPFADGTFDGMFCGCVFPHVGVQGVTYNVTQDYYTRRLKLAREMTRALKPGGKIITCNPNRYFPFDIFHEHTAERFRMRPTFPWNPLLLSLGDYEQLFRAAGCMRAEGLPVENYWGFNGASRSLKGRALSMPVRMLFWLASRERLSALRASFLNPWLIVLIEKGPAGMRGVNINQAIRN
jgi:SAM-dependent methyltransferase